MLHKTRSSPTILDLPFCRAAFGVRQESGKNAVEGGEATDGEYLGRNTGITWPREPGSCVCSICSAQEVASVREKAIAPSLRVCVYLNSPLKFSAPSTKSITLCGVRGNEDIWTITSFFFFYFRMPGKMSIKFLVLQYFQLKTYIKYIMLPPKLWFLETKLM